jgi:putative spermidine/putrescine transport system ATP-binding protein
VSGSVDGLVSLDVVGGGTFSATGPAAAPGSDIDIAVRTDHVRIGESPVKGLGFTGIVSNLEYRGASVKLTIVGAGIAEFTAIITDTAYFATAVAVGDAVPLPWDAQDSIVMGTLD